MSLQYRTEIDGLRFLAVTPVILFHAGLSLASGGYVGVDIFFVISGYLISSIIFQKMSSGGFSILEFYENRARRILPALFFVMLFCLPFAWFWMNPEQWQEFSESMIWTSLFSSNIFFWLHSDYFASASEFKPLLHTWSLAVEEQYYVFFPLLVMMFWRFGTKFLFAVFALIAILSFALCLWLVSKLPEANFFLTPSRVWELLLGVACTAYLIRTAERDATKRLVSEILGCSGLIAILYSIFFFDEHTPFPSAYTLVPVIGTALIIAFATVNTWVGKLLAFKPFVWVGLISYSAYLWHQPLFAFARIKMQGEPDLAIMLGLSLLSIFLAYLSWRFVEQPFRKQKGSARNLGGLKLLDKRRDVFIASILGIVFFTAIGFAQSKLFFQPDRFLTLKSVKQSLKEAGTGRAYLIRYDRCHFNSKESVKERWNCQPGILEDQNLTPIGIAIVGDSHGADRSMMLRLNGYSPMQFGAAGCSLNPSGMRDTCRELFDFAKAEILKNKDISDIWLVNRFVLRELTPEAIEETISYWKMPGKNLVFFSAVPVYPNLKEVLLSGDKETEYPEIEADFELYDQSVRPEIAEVLTKNDVKLVDLVAFICESRSTCDYKTPQNELLYIDPDHMSPLSAKIAGNKLILEFKRTDPNSVFRKVRAQTSE
ncbi:O-acetyltransferase OatA [Halioglobus japonicus]|nr:O-acetyltransferase OatA [Halioglobus japonicus]